MHHGHLLRKSADRAPHVLESADELYEAPELWETSSIPRIGVSKLALRGMENVEVFHVLESADELYEAPNYGKCMVFHVWESADELYEAPELWKTSSIPRFGVSR